MKTINIDDRAIDVYMSCAEFKEYKFTFNNYTYWLDSALNEYVEEFIENPTQEILPGIQITDCCRYYTICHPNPLKSLLCILRLLLFGFHFQLIIDNKRDNYIFPSIRSHEKKLPKFFEPICAEGTCFTSISPDLIEYPEAMGSGPYRCIIWHIFKQLWLFDRPHDEYNIFSLSEILENVTRNQKLLNCCSKNDPCQGILSRLKDGSYETGKPNIDIILTYSNGKYSVTDGNHRICTARRFSIEKIPVMLTTYSCKNEESNRTVQSAPFPNRTSCKKIMKQYKDILHHLNFSPEDGRELLSLSIEESDLVEFLNSKNNMLLSKYF